MNQEIKDKLKRQVGNMVRAVVEINDGTTKMTILLYNEETDCYMTTCGHKVIDILSCCE